MTFWFFKREAPLNTVNICLLCGSERRTYYERTTKAAHVCQCGPSDLFISRTAERRLDEPHSEILHVRKSTFLTLDQTAYRGIHFVLQSCSSVINISSFVT